MGATRSPAWACALVVAAAAHDAPAAVSSYRLQLVRGEGAGSCPSGTMLERDVSQRLGRSPFSEAAERGIEVVIERAEGTWRARLYLRVDASSTDAARVIESDAPDCSELGKAVALAVALAIPPSCLQSHRRSHPPSPIVRRLHLHHLCHLHHPRLGRARLRSARRSRPTCCRTGR